VEPKSISSQLLEVLDSVGTTLRPEDYREALCELRAGEFEVAFEVICQQLFEYSLPLTRGDYDRLAAVGKEMELPERRWKFLERLIAGDA
jgi:hypothetical protein